MKKRLQKKWNRPKILVNDKRYFKPDDISPGAVVAYAVYIPGEREKVSVCR